MVEKVNGIDYKSKKQPLVSVCEKGKSMEQLDWPRDVTVDIKTGNIYIADQSINCVKVFDSTGKYLFKFGDNEDGGKMYLPLSIAICGERILISQYYHCILNYQLNGKFISKIGKGGNGELEFNCPIGLTIDDSNGNIYVSDYHNNLIQIISQDFRFISQFGKIYSNTLLILNSPKYTFSFLMNLILVSISLAIITFYRRVLFLEAKECKLLIHITSSLTKLIIFSFQIMILTPLISSTKNSN